MSKVITLLCAVILTASGGIAIARSVGETPQAEPDGKADKEKLQGEWTVLASASGDAGTSDIRLVFSGNKMALKTKEGGNEIEADFVLDVQKQLKTITITKVDKDSKTPEKLFGVYKFEGTLLLLHMGEKTPEGFRHMDGNKSILLVLEKVTEAKK